jgi:hypothetical protein
MSEQKMNFYEAPPRMGQRQVTPMDAPPAPQRGDLVLVWDDDANRKVKRVFLADVGGRSSYVTAMPHDSATTENLIKEYLGGDYAINVWQHCEPYTEPLTRYTHAELEALIGHKFELVEE